MLWSVITPDFVSANQTWAINSWPHNESNLVLLFTITMEMKDKRNTAEIETSLGNKSMWRVLITDKLTESRQHDLI